MALFDVFVSQADESNWAVATMSGTPKRGVLVLGVEGVDAGAAAKAVSAAIGQDVNEGWRVWPTTEESVVTSPVSAS